MNFELEPEFVDRRATRKTKGHTRFGHRQRRTKKALSRSLFRERQYASAETTRTEGELHAECAWELYWKYWDRESWDEVWSIQVLSTLVRYR